MNRHRVAKELVRLAREVSGADAQAEMESVLNLINLRMKKLAEYISRVQVPRSGASESKMLRTVRGLKQVADTLAKAQGEVKKAHGQLY